MGSSEYYFVGIPQQSELAHCHGTARDGECVWEIRSIPGNLIGIGKTPADAARSLERLLIWRAKEPKFDEWYRTAWSYADPGDPEKYDQVLGGRARTLNPPKKIEDRTELRLALVS
jgi:hypothetical protein